MVYTHGLRGIWYTFFSAWCAISAIVSTRIFRRSLAYTQAEWQSLRFSGLGSELLRGWMAGWSVSMNMFILGWVGMAMGKVCHAFFGGPTGIVNRLEVMGESWRLNPFAFTGWFEGEFPAAWFATMLFIALLGGLGMGDVTILTEEP